MIDKKATTANKQFDADGRLNDSLCSTNICSYTKMNQVDVLERAASKTEKFLFYKRLNKLDIFSSL